MESSANVLGSKHLAYRILDVVVHLVSEDAKNPIGDEFHVLYDALQFKSRNDDEIEGL